MPSSGSRDNQREWVSETRTRTTCLLTIIAAIVMLADQHLVLMTCHQDLGNQRFYRTSEDLVMSRVKLPKRYESREKDGYCNAYIGCFKEISTMFRPMQPGDVLTTLTLYTRTNSDVGFKIPFELVDHYYEARDDDDDDDLGPNQNNTVGSNSSMSDRTVMSRGKLNGRTYPYDLSLMERSGFNYNLTTRIIIAGYFANEDEDWIRNLKDALLNLEDCNVIKVSWTGANHRLYWTAVANTRVVARQISVFLYYMEQIVHSINWDRMHLIGHSLGAHISGFVGRDQEGKIARITGLDPAGPVFEEMEDSLRLDPSDAKFVDVVHTNAGNILSGSLGITLPLGHVDYYPNGGSSQPSCGISIVDLPCNHRASYRFLIEVVRGSASNKSQELDGAPVAFLVGIDAKELLGDDNPTIEWCKLEQPVDYDGLPPIYQIEFHKMVPSFPINERAIYYFKTTPTAPYFAEQFILTIMTYWKVNRKIIFYVRVDDTIVLEESLDEIDNYKTFLFVRPRAIASDDGRQPNEQNSVGRQVQNLRLEIFWKYRFNVNQIFNVPANLNLKGATLEKLTLNSLGSRNNITLVSGSNDTDYVVPKKVWFELRASSNGLATRNNDRVDSGQNLEHWHSLVPET